MELRSSRKMNGMNFDISSGQKECQLSENIFPNYVGEESPQKERFHEHFTNSPTPTTQYLTQVAYSKINWSTANRYYQPHPVVGTQSAGNPIQQFNYTTYYDIHIRIPRIITYRLSHHSLFLFALSFLLSAAATSYFPLPLITNTLTEYL